MPKQPHNEHELELALTRLAGSNLDAVKYRDMISGVILGADASLWDGGQRR